MVPDCRQVVPALFQCLIDHNCILLSNILADQNILYHLDVSLQNLNWMSVNSFNVCNNNLECIVRIGDLVILNLEQSAISRVRTNVSCIRE